AKENLAACDHHWRLQTEHVFHNSLNFNLVGRSEALSDSLNIFLARAGFEPRQAPIAANTSIADVPYNQALADRVYGLYERDFEAYDYARDGWQARAARPRPDTVPEARFLEEVTERNIVIGYLYRQRAELSKRLRLLDPSQTPANLDAHRAKPFKELFRDFIGPIKGWL